MYFVCDITGGQPRAQPSQLFSRHLGDGDVERPRYSNYGFAAKVCMESETSVVGLLLMGIAGVMFTLWFLSMMTPSTTVCRNSFRCLGVNSSRPWPISPRPCQDRLCQPQFLSSARRPGTVIVKLCPGVLKSLGDGLALNTSKRGSAPVRDNGTKPNSSMINN